MILSTRYIINRFENLSNFNIEISISIKYLNFFFFIYSYHLYRNVKFISKNTEFMLISRKIHNNLNFKLNFKKKSFYYRNGIYCTVSLIIGCYTYFYFVGKLHFMLYFYSENINTIKLHNFLQVLLILNNNFITFIANVNSLFHYAIF